MKKIYQAILLFIAASVLTYLMLAFGIWELNPKNWPGEARVFLSILFGFYAAICYPVMQVINEK